jgi:hypothetical protein
MAFALGGTWYLLLAALPPTSAVFTAPGLMFNAEGLIPLAVCCATSLAIALVLRRRIARARGWSLVGAATLAYFASAALLPLLWFATSLAGDLLRHGHSMDLPRTFQDALDLLWLPGVAAAFALPMGVVGIPWACWCVLMLRSIDAETRDAEAGVRPASASQEAAAHAAASAQALPQSSWPRLAGYMAAALAVGLGGFAYGVASPRGSPMYVFWRAVEDPGTWRAMQLAVWCLTSLLVALALRPWLVRARGRSLWAVAAVAWFSGAVLLRLLWLVAIAGRNRALHGFWWPPDDSSGGWSDLWFVPPVALVTALPAAVLGVPLAWFLLRWLRRVLVPSR